MQIIPPIFFLMLFAGCAPGLFDVKIDQRTETYADGTIRVIYHQKVKTYSNGDLYSQYRRTTTTEQEFYPDSVLRSWHRKITRSGEGGGGCYSRIERVREYSNTGIIRKEIITHCDGKKRVTKFYNQEGQIVFTQIERRFL